MTSPRHTRAAAVCLGLLAACSPRVPGAPFEGRDLILITLDTTRADYLGCYGNPLELTPYIDSLAARGALFELAYAPMPQTLPSHASLLTGLSPRGHGSLENAYALPEDAHTLAERLTERGYRTAGVVAASVLSSETGIEQGFETFDEPRARSEPPPEEVGTTDRGRRRRADRVTDAALGWADGLEVGERFFLWAHYYDPHEPFMLPESMLERVSRKAVRKWIDGRSDEYATYNVNPKEVINRARGYASEVLYMDSQVGRLLDGLAERALLDDAVIIVVGDHGEGLGEHGVSGHGIHLFEELMRVPLIVCDQRESFGGRRVETPVALRDVFASAMQLTLGESAPSSVTERGFADELVEERDLAPRPVFLERPHYSPGKLDYRIASPEKYTPGWGVMAAVVHDGFKLIRLPDGTTSLYDLERDAAEAVDLAATENERADELAALLTAWLERNPTPVPGEGANASPDQLEALRALGYAGDE